MSYITGEGSLTLYIWGLRIAIHSKVSSAFLRFVPIFKILHKNLQSILQFLAMAIRFLRIVNAKQALRRALMVPEASTVPKLCPKDTSLSMLEKLKGADLWCLFHT